MKPRSPYQFPEPARPDEDVAGTVVGLLIVALIVAATVALWASEAVFGG